MFGDRRAVNSPCVDRMKPIGFVSSTESRSTTECSQRISDREAKRSCFLRRTKPNGAHRRRTDSLQDDWQPNEKVASVGQWGGALSSISNRSWTAAASETDL